MPVIQPQPPSPVGPLTVPLAKLADMLAETAAFQEAAGLVFPDGDANEKLIQGLRGKKRIFYPALEETEFRDYLPLAIIMQGDDWNMAPVAGGSQVWFHGPTGSLELILAAPDRERSLEAGARAFMNWVGTVIQSDEPRYPERRPGLLDLSGKDDRLAIRGVSQLDKPAISPREEADPYWTVRLNVTYGLENA